MQLKNDQKNISNFAKKWEKNLVSMEIFRKREGEN